MRTWIRKPKTLLLAVVALVTLVLIVIYDYGSYVDSQKDALRRAKRTWQHATQGSDSYRMVVHVTRPSEPDAEYQVTVEGGQVVDVAALSDGRYTSVSLDALAQDDIGLCATVDRMFDFAASKMDDESPWDWEIAFDPDLGYIKSFKVSCMGGLTAPAMRNCQEGFTVASLELLP